MSCRPFLDISRCGEKISSLTSALNAVLTTDLILQIWTTWVGTLPKVNANELTVFVSVDLQRVLCSRVQQRHARTNAVKDPLI